MSWRIDGRYFENCSCEMLCPCTITLDAGADYDRCKALLAFHVDSGEVEGVDVSGLTVGVIADSPKVMTDGNWQLALAIDDAASAEQAEKLAAVFGGELGGPMEALGPLIGEMLGVERVPIEFGSESGRHRVAIGDSTEIEVEDVVPFGIETGEAAKIVDVNHPANSALTVSRATTSRVNVLGLEFSNVGKSGCSAPFSWAA